MNRWGTPEDTCHWERSSCSLPLSTGARSVCWPASLAMTWMREIGSTPTSTIVSFQFAHGYCHQAATEPDDATHQS